jgi:hypothetical protein
VQQVQQVATGPTGCNRYKCNRGNSSTGGNQA